jgi:hypothetical protein
MDMIATIQNAGGTQELEKKTSDDIYRIPQVSTVHEERYYQMPEPTNRAQRRKKKALERKLKGF